MIPLKLPYLLNDAFYIKIFFSGFSHSIWPIESYFGAEKRSVWCEYDRPEVVMSSHALCVKD